MARCYATDLACYNIAACCPNAFNLAVFDIESADLAILDDIHAAGVGTSRVAPSHGVMSRDTGVVLKAGA